MVSQEQKLTFQNIDDIFQLFEDLVDQLEKNIDNLTEQELLSRITIIENSINHNADNLDIITENFLKTTNEDLVSKEALQQEIASKLTDLLEILEITKNNLLAKI